MCQRAAEDFHSSAILSAEDVHLSSTALTLARSGVAQGQSVVQKELREILAANPFVVGNNGIHCPSLRASALGIDDAMQHEMYLISTFDADIGVRQREYDQQVMLTFCYWPVMYEWV